VYTLLFAHNDNWQTRGTNLFIYLFIKLLPLFLEAMNYFKKGVELVHRIAFVAF